MDINQFFVGTGAKMSSRHENGEFDAKVSDIVMSRQEGKKTYLKLVLETRFGKAPEFKYFPITENDMIYAASNSDYQKKIINSIEFHKSILVMLGLVHEHDVVSWTQEKMIAAYGSLRGKYIRIRVENDKRDPKYNRTVLLGPSRMQTETTPIPIQRQAPYQPPVQPVQPIAQPAHNPNQFAGYPSQVQSQIPSMQKSQNNEFSDILNGISSQPANNNQNWNLPSADLNDILF
jgi:hypothetical protein